MKKNSFFSVAIITPNLKIVRKIIFPFLIWWKRQVALEAHQTSLLMIRPTSFEQLMVLCLPGVVCFFSENPNEPRKKVSEFISWSIEKDLEAAQDSFGHLFCRRCLIFDCKLHGCSQKLIFLVLPNGCIIDEEKFKETFQKKFGVAHEDLHLTMGEESEEYPHIFHDVDVIITLNYFAESMVFLFYSEDALLLMHATGLILNLIQILRREGAFLSNHKLEAHAATATLIFRKGKGEQ
nr:histone-lysine N-methyltransferase CLF [Tanacetum cinerariifolium]